MDHDLTRLGSREFEHITQALALASLGAAVTVFGDGPDGGREATLTGKATWTETEVWDGYIVVQAKFRQRPLGTESDTRWILQQVKDELEHWNDPQSRRRKRGRLPEYLLLTTNVVLSAAEGGGVDAVGALLTKYASALGLKGWCVWHYDQMCRLLDNSADVRRSFSGLITSGDVLTELHRTLLGHAAELGSTLTAHAAKDLLADRWVRLGEAGAADNEKLSLEQIAIDLPARRVTDDKARTVPAVSHAIAHGDQVLRPSISGGIPPHLVLVGGPGQGKTTLGQLITQTYRVALLERATGLSAEVMRVLALTKQTLAELKLPQPNSKRWPIRVDLANYGDAISGGMDISVLRWLATQVTRRGGIEVSPAQLRDWLRGWPWLVVLDGLDEIASLHAREHLMRQLSDFMVDAAAVDGDLLIVATTRPQGYTGEFSEQDYDHLTLESLSPRQALQYARRLADVRHQGDDDLRRQTLERVENAAREQLTARLMRTPLQVTIMSLLLERRPRPPQDRHGLFDAYFDTIYSREANKPGSLARLLDEHRADVHALHERVGLRLHVLAETAGEADASMSTGELRSLALTRLYSEGHATDKANKLADDIVEASTHRLVLLVPKADIDVGFEVRSLQEFMAARAIVSGDDLALLRRLRLIAPAAHWRNTWLLAAGRIFVTREHLRTQVVALLREIDSEDLLAQVIRVGPGLALDLLEDDLAAKSPQFRRQLVQHAMEILDQPPIDRLDSRASTLQDLAVDVDLRTLIVQALERGIAAGSGRSATTWLLLRELVTFEGGLATKARQLLSGAHLSEPQQVALDAWVNMADARRAPRKPALAARQCPLSEFLKPGIANTCLTGQSADIANALLSELRQTRVDTLAPDYQTCMPLTRVASTPSASSAVIHPDVADALAIALLEIPSESWAASHALWTRLEVARERRAVGNKLLEIQSSEV